MMEPVERGVAMIKARRTFSMIDSLYAIYRIGNRDILKGKAKYAGRQTAIGGKMIYHNELSEQNIRNKSYHEARKELAIKH